MTKSGEARRRAQRVPGSLGNLVLAYVSGGFGLGISSMVDFLVPLRAAELGAPPEVLGLIVGSSSIVPALVAVPLGRLADRIGARRAYVLGTSVTSLIGLGYLAAPSPVWLIGLQLLFGLFRTLAWLASQSYISVVGDAEARGRNTGRFTFVANLGLMLAPLIIGLVAQAAGFRIAFLVVTGVGAGFACVGLAMADVGQSPPSTAKVMGFGDARALLREPVIRFAIMLSAARLWSHTIWIAFYPVFLVGRGMSPGLVGAVVSSQFVLATFTALFSDRVFLRTSRDRMGLGAMVGMGTGLAVAPFVGFVPAVFLPALLFGIGQGLLLPLAITIIGEQAPPDQVGLAMGMRASFNQIAHTAGPILVGPFLGAFGIGVGFGIGAATAAGLAGWAAATLARRR